MIVDTQAVREWIRTMPVGDTAQVIASTRVLLEMTVAEGI